MHDFSAAGYNRIGGEMMNDREMLTSILRNVQTGQLGIRSILDTSLRPALRKVLQTQLQEYNAIEAEVCAAASQRGWELKEIQPARRMAANLRLRRKLERVNTDSVIADMMIRRNTDSMIAALKDQHRYGQQNFRIDALSQRLVDCQSANIRRMQPFL
jgi:hypothetical protein